MDIVDQQDSEVLKLPAELRLEIYEYCLIEHDTIKVTKDLKQPALLSTCRRMRKEAIGVWYFSNSFHFTIVDCDAALLGAFCENIRNYDRESSRYATCDVTMSGTKWNNLIEWCRSIWDSKGGVITYHDNFWNEHTVVYAAHEIAIESRPLS